MKKILSLIIASAMGLASTSTLATEARLIALGEKSESNYFVKDLRSIFRNSALIHDYKNMVTLELDQGERKTPAMGGFLRESRGYVYGVYLGNRSAGSSFVRMLASPDLRTDHGALALASNQFDFFLGSSFNGIKWGANLVYGSGMNKPKLATAPKHSEDMNMALRLGAMTDTWEGYANIALGSESERKNLSLKFDGTAGLQVGGSYTMRNYKYWASYKTVQWDQMNGTKKTEGVLNNLVLGVGKTIELGEDSTITVRAHYDLTNLELEKGHDVEVKKAMLPLVIAYEAKAASWLTLRGSVSHNLMGMVESEGVNTLPASVRTVALEQGFGASSVDGKMTIANSTMVNAGASLMYRNFVIDGVLGAKGSLNSKSLLSKVGMTYKF